MNVACVGNKRVNAYVLSDTTPKLLIDTSLPGMLPQFISQCKAAGIDPAKIPFMMITHFHPDHAGIVQELKNMGVRLVVFGSQEIAVGDVRRMVSPREHFQEIVQTDNLVLRLADSRAFLAKLGIAGEVVGVPTHSEDSVALVLDEGTAFTGDLMPPVLAGADAMQSWRRFRQYRVRNVYPGHGKVWRLDQTSL